MADTTAWIVVGPSSEGLIADHFTPTHLLSLSEGDRASWIMTTIGLEGSTDSVKWVPHSPESIIDDVVLMMALHAFEDEQLVEVASRAIPGIDGPRVDLNADASPAELEPLYELCRGLAWRAALVVTVLARSSLARRVERFESYPFEVRVCTEPA
ncbi:MAG: hypothetical protein WD004_08065 [Actinomycetota bacterium]